MIDQDRFNEAVTIFMLGFCIGAVAGIILITLIRGLN